MASVEFPDGSQPFFNPAAYNLSRREEKKVGRKGRPRIFSDVLGKVEDSTESSGTAPGSDGKDVPVEKLLDSVHEFGDALKAEPTFENLRRYKDAVRAFMKYVVDTSLAVEERTSGTNILKRKKFTLLTVIDQKLDRLAAGVLRDQKDQLELLRRVDEINGLLVDLLQ